MMIRSLYILPQLRGCQPVSAPSLYIDHKLMRWSLDPAASSLCLASRWSEKATLSTMSVWYWRTARGRSFFQPNIRTLWSQPAEARSLPSSLIQIWETPGLTSPTLSRSCKTTQTETLKTACLHEKVIKIYIFKKEILYHNCMRNLKTIQNLMNQTKNNN